MNRLALYALFFLSGASGLIYQVIWVRQFGNVFGNTVYSAALVTAVFMCGLGVGGYLAGAWADRKFQEDLSLPLKWYGIFEVLIAVLGFSIAVLLPNLGGVSASISSYAVGESGWHELSLGSSVFRYGVAIVMLMPITTLMGGTLTLLIRHVVSKDVSAAGWRIGVLYGINALGAALGCFLTDFALVPSSGLFASQSVAAALNLVAGVGALRLSRLIEAPQPSDASSSGSSPEPIERRWDRAVVLTGVTIFFSGFTAMGMEILWFRYLVALIGPYRPVFSLLLTVVLLGIWIGSMGGGYLHRRFGRPANLYAISQAVFVVVSLAGFAAIATNASGIESQSKELWRQTYDQPDWIWTVSRYWLALKQILYVVGIPVLFMGVSFPLANANVQHAHENVAGKAGALYLANTLGAVLGSVITGFVLLPSLGSQLSAPILCGCALVALVPLYFSLKKGAGVRIGRSIKVVFAICIGLGVATLSSWMFLPRNFLLIRSFSQVAAGANIVAMSEGINETLMIVDHPGGSANLLTNGHPMSGTNVEAQRYMRLFAHLPLLLSEQPKQALLICFGVGNTASAALQHPIERLDIADLSRNVLSHAPYFYDVNGRVLDDPRVSVFVNDGRQHLRMQPENTYDLITSEPPPLAHVGVASLYSKEYYELVESRLTEGGFMTHWLPISQVPEDIGLSIVRAFVDVFPDSVLISGRHDHLILVGRKGRAPTIDPAAVMSRLQAMGDVESDLRRVFVGSLLDIVGSFVAYGATLKDVTRGAVPITDDFPIMEYEGVFAAKRRRTSRELFAVREVAQWCPDCFVGGQPIPALIDLPTYLQIQDALYSSDDFLEPLVPPSEALQRQRRPFRLEPSEQITKTVRQSLYLRFTLKTAPQDFQAAQALLGAGEIELAIPAFEDLALLEPHNAAIRAHLGRALFAGGRAAEAIVHLEKAMRMDPSSKAGAKWLKEAKHGSADE